ncbi:DEAD/DEAH box helicase [Nonomuraea jabiensis]|uniref:DEAD/DEAH box helicase n=1 Tax=Nonomuraea jabiensis TaxID=882448 RepID=UPI003D72326E
MSELSPRARKIAALLSDGSLTRAELVARARARFPRQPDSLLSALIDEAVTAGVLEDDAGTVRVKGTPARRKAPASEPLVGEEPAATLRAVAVDLESVVRTSAQEPYTDRRIFQIGAVRFGADPAWSGATEPFLCWVDLPHDEDWQIASESLRERHAASAVPAAQALTELLAYLDGADVVVAYNGTDADFPMLADALDREALAQLPGELVDGYYLSLALWPDAPSYRLASLAEHLDVDTEGLSWHDAGDDAELLRRLLEKGGATVAGWPAELADLVASVVPDSVGWKLLRQMAGEGRAYGVDRRYGHADVAELAGRLLSSHPPRRGTPRADTQSRLQIPERLRGDSGRVDPVALAGVAHGGSARRRPAQEEMASILHSWADSGVSGAVEAPTGTGKSFAILAAALDWLAADPAHNVIVTTYTKQLQAQLAGDLARLDEAVPGLLTLSDIVKGKANRLSLRALVVALADASMLDARRRARTGTPKRFLPQLRFRELLVYLLLRLRAAADPVTVWAAHSVDPVDLPPFFGEFAGPVLPFWLAALSQSAADDYAADETRKITQHTDSVSEALGGKRLILANHALLLAHLDQLEALGDTTLLIVDEAHELENAATSALTTALDYQSMEDLHGELDAWAQEAAPGRTRESVGAVVGNLGMLLDHEHLPKIASEAFDARSAGTLIGSRTVTLVSPYSGTSGLGRVRTLAGVLTRFAGLCDAVIGALGAYRADSFLDFYADERLKALTTRTATLRSAAQTLVADLQELLGTTATNGVPTISDDPEEEHEEHDLEPLDEMDDTPQAAGTQGTLPPGTTNRVVHAEELDLLRAGLRRYQFRLATSPIELPEDPQWRRFLGAFRRTYYVSATLRVAGEWTYLRSRLGLSASVRALHLESPFDLAKQMELVCLADFPSWAEQTAGAIRTMAHQLAGYAAAMIRPATGADGRGGYDGGALIITTARATSGGIADRLADELRRGNDPTPVRSALVRGNRQGFAEFTDHESGGGFLVGTKGLWQGVDVADADRLRLVWINKLPFAPFGDPVVEARRAAVATRAESLGVDDPEQTATESYYLPMAALQLRQGVGRLIRSERHRGVVIISDRKLAGISAIRRSYRRIFLGSLDPELLVPDPHTQEPGGGNVVPMTEAWRRIWGFYVRQGLLEEEHAAQLSTTEALDRHTTLPQTRAIRALQLTQAEVEHLAAGDRLTDEVVRRSAAVAALLRLEDGPVELKPAQEAVIRAVAEGKDVLGLLPTGFGKSYCFQLPALVLPGVTIVVSPLVALMQDQALELNRSIGGAVRALVGPMRESNSRAGRTEVGEQLLDRADHGIRLIYVSPERLCQTRFRELVRAAVQKGIVTRIAIDEAHTAVQWGDDFRPSFRRVERFLAELRADHGLRVTALTATANRTVHAGLRERIFGLGGDGESDALITIRENPIRPELAIYRRAIGAAGPSKVAGLLEQVVQRLDGHAIFYCLTVKEVNAVHAHLRDHIGDGRVVVRRFHGRLTEAEKAAVMTEFREAPRRGEEGFVPLLVVATSAFGLGVDRPDVRTVFCISPPTDLAALYQQIGRAGRDSAGGRGQPETVNAGLALATNRGLRTAQFMTSKTVSASLERRMGAAVLSCADGVLDASEIADRLIGEDLAAGRLDAVEARASRTHDEYADSVVRTFAALADLGAVEDLGDFPFRAAVKCGELPMSGPYADETEEKVVAAVLALPAREGRLPRSALPIVALHQHLTLEIPDYRAVAPHPASTWEMLADLHDRGRLDVSAALSRRFVTGITVLSRDLPPGFHAVLSQRARRATAELEQLRDFFNDTKTCANRKFAEYFEIADLPEGCCTSPENRCSACWANQPAIPMGQTQPQIGLALASSGRNTAAARNSATVQSRKLDQQLRALLWQVYRGLTADHLRLALRGEDSWFHAGRRRRMPLPRTVTASRFFGAAPGVSKARIEDSLSRLQEEGLVVTDGRLWRDIENVRREAARKMKEER